MELTDLHYIFKDQLAAKEDKLYFMLIDGDYKIIERHRAAAIEELLPMLSSFEYVGSEASILGSEASIPRFKK